MAKIVSQLGWLLTGKKYVGRGKHWYTILTITISKGQESMVEFQDEFGVKRTRSKNVFIDKFLP